MASLSIAAAVASFLGLVKSAAKLTAEDRQFIGLELSEARLSDEKRALALWVITWSLRHTSPQSWRNHAEAISSEVTSRAPADGEVADDAWIASRFHAYQQCHQFTAAEFSLATLSQRLGAAFASLCGADGNRELGAYGAKIYETMLPLMHDFMASLELQAPSP